MTRNYATLCKSIALSGFFSEYLPPCFYVDSKILSIGNPPEKTDLIEPLCFTMSRYNSNDARRSLFLPEITTYLALYSFMRRKDIFKEVIEFTETQNASFSPILGKNDSIYKHEQSYDKGIDFSGISSSDYIENVAKKIKRAQGAKQIIKLDIANCFASYYTHMTPAIFLGVEEAGIQYKKKHENESASEVYSKYAELDKLLRQQNQNRTNGLLLGTLISKIIAEGILTRIDIELKAKGLTFSRYMDDYEVCLYGNDADDVIQIFIQVLKRYCFALNNEKTENVSFPYYVTENLENIFQKYSREQVRSSDLMDLFSSFSLMETNGTKGALRYLLKSLEKNPINAVDSSLYKAYLFSILENDKRSLSKVCTLLIDNKKDLKLTIREKQYLNGLVCKHLKLNQDLEVIWLVYLLAETNLFRSNKKIVKQIVNSNNELAQMILYKKGLLYAEDIERLCESSVSWLLLYELFSDGHIEEDQLTIKLGLNKSRAFYVRLKNESIHFWKCS